VSHAREYLDSVGNRQTVLFTYRQVQVALRLFGESARAAGDPALEPHFLHDVGTGKLCVVSQRWGTMDPYWNFSNEDATEQWLNSVVLQLTQDPSLVPGRSAVFFDSVDQSTCGYRGSFCEFSDFNRDALHRSTNSMVERTVRRLNGAGIVPILSLDNRMAASSKGLEKAGLPCALPEDDLVDMLRGLVWARFYEFWPSSPWVEAGPDLDAAMIANAVLEADAGIPTVLHMGWPLPGLECPAKPRRIERPGPLGGDLEFEMAGYLVVQSEGTTLSLSYGWSDQDFCWRPEYDVDYGTPLGPPVRTGAHSWARNYTRSRAVLNVSARRFGSVYLLA